jgi:hypothetical protein
MNSRDVTCPPFSPSIPTPPPFSTEQKEGVSVEVVSDRCNVSPVVIDEHYDVRTAEEKMQQREALLPEALG